MSPSGSNQVTELLGQWKDGDKKALDSLMPLVYGELRRVARHHLQGERLDHTLQSTALVHEAYLRLVSRPAKFHNRQHFYAVAAHLMRQILVDFARSRHAAKREPCCTLALDDAVALPQARTMDLLALDRALKDLSRLSQRQARIVELRFFAGLSISDMAEILGVSASTIERDWLNARAWLYREISGSARS
jgi:RNA polymerase sigma factor (TIGR02999 family)